MLCDGVTLLAVRSRRGSRLSRQAACRVARGAPCRRAGEPVTRWADRSAASHGHSHPTQSRPPCTTIPRLTISGRPKTVGRQRFDAVTERNVANGSPRSPRELVKWSSRCAGPKCLSFSNRMRAMAPPAQHLPRHGWRRAFVLVWRRRTASGTLLSWSGSRS